jgi:hypothetical protein
MSLDRLYRKGVYCDNRPKGLILGTFVNISDLPENLSERSDIAIVVHSVKRFH